MLPYRLGEPFTRLPEVRAFQIDWDGTLLARVVLRAGETAEPVAGELSATLPAAGAAPIPISVVPVAESSANPARPRSSSSSAQLRAALRFRREPPHGRAPYLKGLALYVWQVSLLRELERVPLWLPDGLEIEWLGVDGYRLTYEGVSIFVDPYMSRVPLARTTAAAGATGDE